MKQLKSKCSVSNSHACFLFDKKQHIPCFRNWSLNLNLASNIYFEFIYWKIFLLFYASKDVFLLSRVTTRDHLQYNTIQSERHHEDIDFNNQLRKKF